MNFPKSLIVLGMPRSGTSLTAHLCIDAGYNPSISEDSKFFGGSPFNKGGYYEEVRLTMLNDQIIRILFGEKYSFLYPPESIIKKGSLLTSNFKFAYDIVKGNLEIPNDFNQNIKKYTGIEKDIWGLTRMLPGGKWFKGYKKFGVHNETGIKKYLSKYSDKVSMAKGLIIKDPRLCFTINEYDFESNKIIIVKRSAKAHKNSLIRHYGPRFLSKKKYSKFSWTSNHFNLKIPPITYNEFSSSYIKNISKIKESHKDFLEIDYENLINKDPMLVSNLESFIGAKINKDIINT